MPKPRMVAFVGFIKRVGEKVPRSPKEMGSLRLRLVQAGYRREEALTFFFGIRVVFALALFALFSIVDPHAAEPDARARRARLRLRACPAWCSRAWRSGARTGSGCRSPTCWTCWSSASRPGSASTRRCRASAPSWPSRTRSSPSELKLINLELRAGKPRAEALRNLADRTGVDDLSSLVTMLIQTDKFGTSVAQSLRVYSETLRTKRRQRAEEAAAKTGVKMVFPLVFCIFPAIWVVTIGPAAIKFVTVLFPLIEKSK